MEPLISLDNDNIQLRVTGEMRFGPSLFDLTIFNLKIPNSSFFEWFVYSKELGKFIISEYVYSNGRDFYTQLAIFDLDNRKKSLYGRLKNGFIKPTLIEGKKLIFTREIRGLVKEYEISIDKISIRNNV